MALSIVMSSLVTRCARRCDRESDSSIATAEWKALIHEVWSEGYSAVVESGSRYHETESTITATGATSYDEPDDMLHLVGIDLVIDGAGRRRTLREIMAQERQNVAGETGEASFYALVDDQIVLYPNPSGGTYKVVYVPQPTDLSAAGDSDNVDVWCPAGLRFVVWGVAGLAQHKGEVNQIRAVQEQARALEDLRYWASLRALHTPRRRIVEAGVDFDSHDPDFWSDPP